MRATAARQLLRPFVAPATLVSLALGACVLAGCSQDSSETVMESIFFTSPAVPVQGGTQASNPNEPMTLYEKRRLLARLQQDPRTLQRLTPRERREVAAMVAATKDDDESRD